MQTGTIFDKKYEILEALGAGGIGTVYKARQLDCDRIVALKILHDHYASDEELQQRFLQEAKTLNQLAHANIVTIYHLGLSDEQRLYLAMEYVAGQTLQRRMQEAKLTVEQTLDITLALADALAYVHSFNIVHRDLKPANILLCKSRDETTPKLIDFGLVRLLENDPGQKLTQTGMLIGTPHYMSPEQCMGKVVDARSDVYSLAVCFYEMLTGKYLFDADSGVGIMYLHKNQAIPELTQAQFPGLSVQLNQILKKGLAKSPEDRYQSMAEFSRAFSELLPSLPFEGAPTARAKKINARVLALGITLAIAICGICGLISKNFLTQKSTRDSVHSPAIMNSPRSFLVAKASPYREIVYLNRVHSMPASATRYPEAMCHYADTLLWFGFPQRTIELCKEQCKELLRKGIWNASDNLINGKSYFTFRHLEFESQIALGHTAEATKIFDETLEQVRSHRKAISIIKAALVLKEALALKLSDQRLKKLIDLAKDGNAAADMIKVFLECGKIKLAEEYLSAEGQRFAETLAKPNIFDQTTEDESRFSVALEKAAVGIALETRQTQAVKPHLRHAITDLRTIVGLSENYYGYNAERKALSSVPTKIGGSVLSPAKYCALAGQRELMFQAIEAGLKNQEIPLTLAPGLSANELDVLLHKNGDDHSLQLYKYILDSNKLSAFDKCFLLYNACYIPKLPDNVRECMPVYSYFIASAAADIPQSVRLTCIDRIAYEYLVERMPHRAIKIYTEELDEAKINGVGTPVERMPPRGSCTNAILFLAQTNEDFGNTAKANELLDSIAATDALNTWTAYDLSKSILRIGNLSTLKKMIDACPSTDRLRQICQNCRKQHLQDLQIACINRARQIEQDQTDPRKKILDKASCCMMEILLYLETNDSPEKFKLLKDELAKQCSSAVPAAQETADLDFLRELMNTCTLSGLELQAFQIDEVCEKLEREKSKSPVF